MNKNKHVKQNSIALKDKPPESLRLRNQICFPLYSASNAIIRAYRPYLAELDLTYLQYMVLMVLWEESTLNVKELGECLNLDSGTLTPLLKRLESKGMVSRERSKLDERSRIISITNDGKALQHQAEIIPEKLSCDVGLDKEELQQLSKLCKQLLLKLSE